MHLVFFFGSVIGVLGFWLVVQLASSDLVASIFQNVPNQPAKSTTITTSKNTAPVRVPVTKVEPRNLSSSVKITSRTVSQEIKPVKVPALVPVVTKPKKQFLKIAPVKKSGPKIILVIDDIGYHNKLERLLFSTGVPLTLAILPQLQYSAYFSKEGKRRGYEIILHQPMEPESALSEYDPGVIKSGMSREVVLYQLRKNLESVPDAEGINNHMGSRITQNRNVMRWVLEELKRRNMFFLDSVTSDKSVGWIEARRNGMFHPKRDVFLDNEDSAPYIESQLWSLVELAKSQGTAIGIGHYRKNTLEVIRRLAPRIKRQGVQIVTLKEIS